MAAPVATEQSHAAGGEKEFTGRGAEDAEVRGEDEAGAGRPQRVVRRLIGRAEKAGTGLDATAARTRRRATGETKSRACG